MRDGTRWRHPGQPILPLVVVAADGRTDYRCLSCGRPVHTSRRARGWRHHQRPWSGRRNGL